MRILVDYRPALRARTGVGEWVHQMARAMLRASEPEGNDPVHLTLFTSSWKDRPDAQALAELGGASVVDRRIPVSALNFAWHRLGWPSLEALTGRPFDVVLAPHPLLIPAVRGLGVVTVHDLDFLDHPERTRAEVRRDYPALARSHTARAALVVAVSRHTAGQVEHRLGVPSDRIVVCPSGVPEWALAAPRADRRDGHILFVGTLEPRKNVAGLLRAFRMLAERMPRVPRLVLVGRVPPDAGDLLDEVTCPPLAGLVDIRGYVDEAARREAYGHARVLVLPSFEEGFGLPVLEAMATGVPVVVADRGALPEVAGNAGTMVDPERPDDIARGLERVLRDDAYAASCVERGLARARVFTWEESARTFLDACRHRLASPGQSQEAPAS